MKAVILAAGEGRRLEPLTHHRPKPMVPIANQPLLEYVVQAVADAGIGEIVLVVGYKRERIQSYFENGDDWGVDIEYAVQDKQLGTGHAILQAESHVDDDFLVLNGDRIIDSSLVERFIDIDCSDNAYLAVSRVDAPERYGVVELDADRVTTFTEKPTRERLASDLINAGVYCFSPGIFEAIHGTDTAESGELAITDTLQSFIDDDQLHAVRYDGRWLDVSYLWDVVWVNGEILDRDGHWSTDPASVHDSAYVSDKTTIGQASVIEPNAAVLRGTGIGDNVRVGSNAVIENSVVLSDVSIRPGAVVRDSIIAENATIGPNTTIEGGPAAVIIEGTLHEDVMLGGVIGDNTRLGGNVGVAPGGIIGDGARVETGVTLADRIPPNADVRRG